MLEKLFSPETLNNVFMLCLVLEGKRILKINAKHTELLETNNDFCKTLETNYV